MQTFNTKNQITEKQRLIEKYCTGNDAISSYNKRSLRKDIQLLELLNSETYELEDYQENTMLYNKKEFQTINESFRCFTDFDGFKIGNPLDEDIIIRAFGSTSGTVVADIKGIVYINDSYYRVEIDLISVGDQKLLVDSDNEDAISICKEYHTTVDEFLEEFNNCQCIYESKYYLYKKLSENGLTEWKNNSWFEPRVVIKNLSGNTMYDAYESGTLDVEVYDSIENFKTLVQKSELNEYAEYYLDNM